MDPATASDPAVPQRTASAWKHGKWGGSLRLLATGARRPQAPQLGSLEMAQNSIWQAWYGDVFEPSFGGTAEIAAKPNLQFGSFYRAGDCWPESASEAVPEPGYLGSMRACVVWTTKYHPEKLQHRSVRMGVTAHKRASNGGILMADWKLELYQYSARCKKWTHCFGASLT